MHASILEDEALLVADWHNLVPYRTPLGAVGTCTAPNFLMWPLACSEDSQLTCIAATLSYPTTVALARAAWPALAETLD